MEEEIFKFKTPNENKLLAYGFKLTNGEYVLKTQIMNNQFTLYVVIKNKTVSTKVVDNFTEDVYILHRMPEIVGKFVGKVRTEIFNILTDIVNDCFSTEYFSSKQAKEVINYVEKTYSRDLEYLWPKFPNNAIWRREDNKKWFGLIMAIPNNKLGLEGEQVVEVLNIRMDKLAPIVDNKYILPAYHMNKKSWCSICLNNTLDNKEIFALIDESYKLAKK